LAVAVLCEKGYLVVWVFFPPSELIFHIAEAVSIHVVLIPVL